MKNSGMKNRGNKQKTNNEVEDLNPNISLSTLNVNGQNIPIKSQR